MRRNTVTILKYALFALGFLIVGPVSLKYLFGENHREGRDTGQGLPQPPDEHREIVKREEKHLQSVLPQSTKGPGPVLQGVKVNKHK